MLMMQKSRVEYRGRVELITNKGKEHKPTVHTKLHSNHYGFERLLQKRKRNYSSSIQK
jgi:hypothetical protein